MGTACVAEAETGDGDPPRKAARPAGVEEEREADSPCFVPGPGWSWWRLEAARRR
jgi:hypothetical protein